MQIRKDIQTNLIRISHFFLLWGLLLAFVCTVSQSTWAQPWWSKTTTEESREIDAGLQYERVLYETVLNEPVRAHILSVTNTNSPYIFGVLGSFGTLFQPSQFSKNSGAVAAINGSFYTTNPTRALGMVTAHGRVLYPPRTKETFHGTVGFTPNDVLFGFLGPEDVQDQQLQDTDNIKWSDCHAAIGTGPMLILNGKNVFPETSINFNTTQRAPRSAIAKTRTGNVLMVVVDGRQPGWSAGVTLEELLEMFLDLKVTDALNLDGGGSSAMILENEVVNRPSDGAFQGAPGIERPVVNVIALLRK